MAKNNGSENQEIVETVVKPKKESKFKKVTFKVPVKLADALEEHYEKNSQIDYDTFGAFMVFCGIQVTLSHIKTSFNQYLVFSAENPFPDYVPSEERPE